MDPIPECPLGNARVSRESLQVHPLSLLRCELGATCHFSISERKAAHCFFRHNANEVVVLRVILI
jgi:hypothetical protein